MALYRVSAGLLADLAHFTERGSTSGTFTLTTDGGVPVIRRQVSGFNTGAFVSFDPAGDGADTENVEVAVLMRSVGPDAERLGGPAGRGHTSGSDFLGISFQRQTWSPSEAQEGYGHNGVNAANQLPMQVTGLSVAADWHWTAWRAETDGSTTTVRVKTWALGESIPESWAQSFTGRADHYHGQPGFAGFVVRGNVADLYVREIAIGTAGDPAPVDVPHIVAITNPIVGAGSTLTVPLPAHEEGDRIVIFGATGAGSTPSNLAPPAGGGWDTLVNLRTDVQFQPYVGGAFTKIAGAAEADPVFTDDAGTQSFFCQVVVVRGAGDVDDFAYTEEINESNTLIDAPAVDVLTDGSLVLTGFHGKGFLSGGHDFTPPAGVIQPADGEPVYSGTDGNQGRAEVAYFHANAGALPALGWTVTAEIHGICYQLVIAPAGAGGGAIEGTVAEASDAAEVVSAILRSMRSSSDAAEAAAAQSAQLTAARSLADTTDAADVVNVDQALESDLSEGAIAADDPGAQLTSARSVAESSGNSDAVAAAAQMTGTVADQLNASAIAEAAAVMGADITEASAAGDTPSTSSAISAAVVEAAQAASAVTALLVAFQSVIEGADAAAQVASDRRSSATVSEAAESVATIAAQIAGSLQVTVAERVDAAAAVSTRMSYAVTLTSGADGAETVRAVMVTSVSVGGAASAAESVSRGIPVIPGRVTEGAESDAVHQARFQALATALDAVITEAVVSTLARAGTSTEEGAVAAFEIEAVLDSDRFVLIGEARIRNATPVIRITSIRQV